MFFSFCPHCGQSIDQEQTAGQTLLCKHCGKQIGVVGTPQKAAVVDQTQELIQRGVAARCALCQQVVELKGQPASRTFVPHYTSAPPRRICPNSGKPVAPAPAAASPAPRPTAGGKDLAALMTKESVRVVSCRKAADPMIEELSLAYLDKSDRVRIQIEALRDVLGADFRMKAYPATLNRPHLAVWGNTAACVVAGKHERGGFQHLSDGEIRLVVEDLRRNPELFYA